MSIPVGLRNSVAVSIGIVTATTATASNYKFAFGSAEIFGSWSFWFEGVTSGAVLGGFVWILLKPRARLTQGIVKAVTINWAAWVLFLLSTPALPESEFQQIADTRARRDAGGGMDLMTDGPTIMAARQFGGFGGMSATERFLFFMAGVPVLITERYVVPTRYVGTPPNRAESHVMAGTAFVLSTAFWASCAGAFGGLRRRRVAARLPNAE